MSLLRQLVWIFALAALPAALSAWYQTSRPSWQQARADEIEISSALALTDVIWIDARTRGEYDQAHVDKALHLDEDAWDQELPAVLQTWSPGRTVVVYCDSSSCQSSHSVARRLREAGVSPVLVIRGGWQSWLKR